MNVNKPPRQKLFMRRLAVDNRPRQAGEVAGSAGAGTSSHDSLEGVGGLKTNEAYHSKADTLVVPEMYFF